MRVEWGWARNYDEAYNGRLWIAWDKSLLSIQVLQVDDQIIHMNVIRLKDSFQFLYSAIYAWNSTAQRESLWTKLTRLAIQSPWIL